MATEAPKMSAVELFKKLKDSHCTGTKLAQLRAWLIENRDASADDMIEHAEELARNQPRLGSLGPSTVAKMRNLAGGLHPYHGHAMAPRGWDPDIDGPFNPAKVRPKAQPTVPTAPTPIKTAGKLGVAPASPQADAGPVQNVVQPVLTEVAPPKEADLGPKPVSKKEEMVKQQGYRGPGR